MKLVLATTGIRNDVWLQEWVRSQVGFAARSHWPDVQAVRVQIASPGAGAGEFVRCVLLAETRQRGSVTARAVAGDVCNAVQRALDRLEVALFRAATSSLGVREPARPTAPHVQPAPGSDLEAPGLVVDGWVAGRQRPATRMRQLERIGG